MHTGNIKKVNYYYYPRSNKSKHILKNMVRILVGAKVVGKEKLNIKQLCYLFEAK